MARQEKGSRSGELSEPRGLVPHLAQTYTLACLGICSVALGCTLTCRHSLSGKNKPRKWLSYRHSIL